MRILQIEDDSATAQTVELMLMSEGFNVYTTDLGEEGVDLAKVYDYDLITLDLNLPDMSGHDVLRQIRAAKVSTPILILSATTDITAKVRTLGGGADDYMTKPFHKDELVARINAIIRRSRGHAESVIQVGPVAVNLDQKRVTVDGIEVHVTGKEYQMLELLALRRGTTLTKEMFLNHLYGGMDEPELKIIDVFICKLRRKLTEAGAPNYIQTVWGRGYVLVEEAASLPGRAAVEREGKPGPKADQLETVAGRMLRCLAEEGDATVKELVMAVRKKANHVTVTMRQVILRGYAGKVSRGREATYRISEDGVAWLKAHGWEAPRMAAAQ